MNLYYVVEGAQTEMSVYPNWMSILAPKYSRIHDAWDVSNNCYYMFSGGGIPSIFTHVVHAIEDINMINRSGKGQYDYLLVCMDTEDGTREEIESTLKSYINEAGVRLNHTELVLFEHKVCMESWFLGNSKVFKSNPQDPEYLEYITFYDVSKNNPETMDSIDNVRFSTKAQFHFQYLRKMLAERQMHYSKNNTKAVCSDDYLKELIKRYNNTKHIKSFGAWLSFIQSIA